MDEKCEAPLLGFACLSLAVDTVEINDDLYNVCERHAEQLPKEFSNE